MADPLLNLNGILRPGETRELRWELPDTCTGTAEVAVYIDPSSLTTHVRRARTSLPG